MVNEPAKSVKGERACDGESCERSGKPRLVYAVRNQLEFAMVDLDGQLEPEHEARTVWQYVEGLNLEGILDKIGSVEHHAGRPAIDPQILMSLWLYATLEGVGSSRQLQRL